MGSFSFWHWIVVLVIILIIFGAGKLPQVAGDVAKGIKAFRSNMKDDAAPAGGTSAGETASAQPKPVEGNSAPAAQGETKKDSAHS